LFSAIGNQFADLSITGKPEPNHLNRGEHRRGTAPIWQTTL
jgi:hypothetical protein